MVHGELLFPGQSRRAWPWPWVPWSTAGGLPGRMVHMCRSQWSEFDVSMPLGLPCWSERSAGGQFGVKTNAEDPLASGV
jgi:hypothetical protein